jgi:hypothetical protein
MERDRPGTTCRAYTSPMPIGRRGIGAVGPAGRPLLAALTTLALAAGCSDGARLTPIPTATSAPTVTATPFSAPPSQAATIGEPADDGARLIAVDTNPPVVHCDPNGCSDPVFDPDSRARDLTIDSPAVGVVKVRLLLPPSFDRQPEARWPVL